MTEPTSLFAAKRKGNLSPLPTLDYYLMSSRTFQFHPGSCMVQSQKLDVHWWVIGWSEVVSNKVNGLKYWEFLKLITFMPLDLKDKYHTFYSTTFKKRLLSKNYKLTTYIDLLESLMMLTPGQQGCCTDVPSLSLTGRSFVSLWHFAIQMLNLGDFHVFEAAKFSLATMICTIFFEHLYFLQQLSTWCFNFRKTNDRANLPLLEQHLNNGIGTLTHVMKVLWHHCNWWSVKCADLQAKAKTPCGCSWRWMAQENK